MASQRWKEDLIELGKMGRQVPLRVESYDQLDPAVGLSRLEGTPQCKTSKEYIITRMKEAGLDVRIDQVGNIFGRKEGAVPGQGAVMSGSHLDSVKNGGMFDGPLGVVGALEAVRIMNDEGFVNDRPIEVAAFMGEEGSAFGKALLGSLVLCGVLPAEEALAMKNEDGVPLKEALDKQGLRGDFEMDLSGVEYFIETHIEQGPVLDQEKIPIGIVENITGLTWINATIKGEENHAGTTPMAGRKDPLVAAATVVLAVNRGAVKMVEQFGGSTVATVGRLIVHPGAPNVVPGTVEMGIDIRDGDLERLRALREEIVAAFKQADDRYGVESMVEIPFEHPASPCAREVVDALEQAASAMGATSRRMNSGAGHDAQNLAKKVKTGMLFVPSINGISHSPMEWTEWEDLEKGIHVLSRTLKSLSKI